jgi:uncharacterized protein (TIGR03083 family)
MDVSEHIDVLRSEGARMAAVIAATAPDAPVPSCPEWVLQDLVQHLGRVHRWATAIVSVPHTKPDFDLDALVGPWPEDDALAGWFAEGHARLVEALSSAPRDLECWAFLRAPSPLAMWARRQAHETAIHRVDADLAAGVRAGDLAPFSPAFAADGVGELLTCFVPRRSTGLRADTPARLAVQCLDHDAAWALSIGPDGVTATAAPAADASTEAATEADCTVRGAAGDLYVALWNRGNEERLQIDGDAGVLASFGEAVQIRWS